MVFNTQHQGLLLETARKGRIQSWLTTKKERRDDYSQRRRSNAPVPVAFLPPPLHFQPPPLLALPLSVSLPLCICQLTAARPSPPPLHLHPVRVLQPVFLRPSFLTSLTSLSSIRPRHLFLRPTHGCRSSYCPTASLLNVFLRHPLSQLSWWRPEGYCTPHLCHLYCLGGRGQNCSSRSLHRNKNIPTDRQVYSNQKHHYYGTYRID